KNDKSAITCYKCKLSGHYANECSQRSQDKKINTINDHSTKTDVREIKINERILNSLFDSGASANFIGKNIWKKIRTHPEVIIQTDKEFQLADKSTCKVTEMVNVCFTYDGKNYTDQFYILTNNPNAFIIGFPLIRKINDVKNDIENLNVIGAQQRFPVTCSIKTKSEKVISWTRPIKSYHQKQKFEKIIVDLEERGIIEPSTSKWCHPVVLTTKKNG
ncbi:hypothetical protein EDEG_04246, partial [Edhazardia aedis USNM 41457]